MKLCGNRVNISVLFKFNTLLYSIQYLVIGIANCAAVPVVVGTSLGLNAEGIARFAQRTLFFFRMCLLAASNLGT